jgi:hypothetical protein
MICPSPRSDRHVRVERSGALEGGPRDNLGVFIGAALDHRHRSASRPAPPLRTDQLTLILRVN